MTFSEPNDRLEIDRVVETDMAPDSFKYTELAIAVSATVFILKA